MLEVSSGTRSLSGKNAGRPITQTAPSTVPATEPSPPITTIDTSEQRVGDGEEAVARDRLDVGGEERAAEGGEAAGQGEGPELRPGGRDGVGGGRVGVVAHGDRRPARRRSPAAGHTMTTATASTTRTT